MTRHVRWAPIAFALVAAIVANPSAAACYRISMEGFDVVDWTNEDVLAVNVGYAAAVLDVPTGYWKREAAAGPDLHVTMSPDGRWLVYTTGTYREEGPPNFIDACDVGYAHLLAKDLGTREVTRVDERGARAIAASPAALAYAQGSHVVLVSWDGFSELGRVDVGDAVRGLAFAEDGRRLAAWAGEEAVAIDVQGLSVVSRYSPAHDEARIPAAALSPDGRLLAVVDTEPWPSRNTSIIVQDVASHERLSEALLRNTSVSDMAWGSGGLAIVQRQARDTTTTELVLLDEALRTTHSRDLTAAWTRSLAWSPAGDRLAVGGDGTLLILDRNLEVVANHSVERPGSAPADDAPEVPPQPPPEESSQQPPATPTVADAAAPPEVEGGRAVAAPLALAALALVAAAAAARGRARR